MRLKDPSRHSSWGPRIRTAYKPPRQHKVCWFLSDRGADAVKVPAGPPHYISLESSPITGFRRVYLPLCPLMLAQVLLWANQAVTVFSCLKVVVMRFSTLFWFPPCQISWVPAGHEQCFCFMRWDE